MRKNIWKPITYGYTIDFSTLIKYIHIVTSNVSVCTAPWCIFDSLELEWNITTLYTLICLFSKFARRQSRYMRRNWSYTHRILLVSWRPTGMHFSCDIAHLCRVLRWSMNVYIYVEKNLFNIPFRMFTVFAVLREVKTLLDLHTFIMFSWKPYHPAMWGCHKRSDMRLVARKLNFSIQDYTAILLADTRHWNATLSLYLLLFRLGVWWRGDGDILKYYIKVGCYINFKADNMITHICGTLSISPAYRSNTIL